MKKQRTARAEIERLRAELDESTRLHFAAHQRFERAEAERDALRKDAQMLDWLEKHCTGASDSERYLPFRIYWKHKGIRRAIGDAMKEAP